MTAKIRFVSAEITLGKLPAQDVCKLAAAELQKLYEQGQVEIAEPSEPFDNRNK